MKKISWKNNPALLAQGMINKKNVKDFWDVVVVGGGPAGMMAAGRAAELGRSVLLLEKNPVLGKKLQLTGGGRCNLTNNIPDARVMLSKYKNSGKYLFSAFSRFGFEETINFFNDLGIKTKTEERGRIFPISDKAKSILDALIGYMKKAGVKIRLDSTVTGITNSATSKTFSLHAESGEIINTRSCIVATGGIACPSTGSTGEGFLWLEKLGHTIIELRAILVPVTLKDNWVKKVSGLTLKNVKLVIFHKGKKRGFNSGELLFTHFGISGPAVLNLSNEIGSLLQCGEIIILLDLFPDIDQAILKQKIQTILVSGSNKTLKNTLGKILPAAMVAVLLEVAKIDGEIACHSVRHEHRERIIKYLKAFPLRVKGLSGADKAIASSGGVPLSEINCKTMESRLVPNLFIIGDALDIDRPTGGFSLQLCWTTGFVAGSSC